MLEFTLGALTVGAVLALVRMAIGPSVQDRVVALDVALVCLMSAVIVDAVRRDDPTYLYLPVVVSVIGFVATLAATKYLNQESQS